MFCGVCTVSDCKGTKLLKAIHNNVVTANYDKITVSDCKGTKLLKAIHNVPTAAFASLSLFQTAKVQNF